LKNYRNSRINKVKQVNDAVVLKDLQVANEERHLEKAKEKVFERLLSYLMVLLWTTEFENFHENAEQKPSANHHEYKNDQRDVNQIEILKNRYKRQRNDRTPETYHCVVCVGVRKPPH
jgi:hypothetical protein